LLDKIGLVSYTTLRKELMILWERKGVGDEMTNVIIRRDETFEKALRRFNKSCEKAGILADIKKHQHFEKPSERRKRRLAAARRKSRRREEY
jgi:small subunit ribosomal protein S21